MLKIDLSTSTQEYINSKKYKNNYVTFDSEAPYLNNKWSKTGIIKLDDTLWKFYSRTKELHNPTWSLINTNNEIIQLTSNELDLLLGNHTEKIHQNIKERFEEIESNIFATDSVYDVINILRNKPKSYRLVYDNNIHMYFIGDAFNYIHQDLLEAAFRSGFYPNMLSEEDLKDYLDDCLYDGQNLLLLAFSPDVNRGIDIEKSSDGYTRKYVYDFGAIYAHEITPLENFDLYKKLGVPIKKEDVFENMNPQKLNIILEQLIQEAYLD